MEENSKRLLEIKRFSLDGEEYLTDLIVREVSLEIYINGRRFIGLSCIPEYFEDLAIGFLYSEGIIINPRELLSYKFDHETISIFFECDIPNDRIQQFMQSRERTSGCASSLSSSLSGHRKNFPKLSIKRELIIESMIEFQKNSQLFKETGGVHSAGMIREEKIDRVVNDIGRHNAIDKVAGYYFRQSKDLSDSIIISTGRISSEIVKKTIRLGIPILVSHSAPTSEAVRLAWDYKLYLIGFSRGTRFNLYTGFNEINIK